MKALKSLTVHAIGCSQHLPSIRLIAESLAEVLDIQHYPQEGSGYSPIQAWERAKDKAWVPMCINADPLVPILDEATCFISNCELGPMSPHVAYALYTKQIPVLCLQNSKGVSAWPVAERRDKHPLYEDLDSLGQASAEAAISTFLRSFRPIRERGKVIVVEGGDGAGKETQCKMLVLRLRADGHTAETLDFPHDAAHCGDLIRLLLSGKVGGLREVNPLLFASLYSMNRFDTLPWIKYWLMRGSIVVLDRYMSANFGHQASKYETAAERNHIINILKAFETKWLRLPAPDAVLYLNLPPMFAWKALMGDQTRVMLDMHEKAGIEYKTNVQQAFLWCCAEFAGEGWREVKCVDEGETVRFTRDEVHEKVYSIVRGVIGSTHQQTTDGEKK